jgi:TP901 family phage tail tape measure protein
MAAIASVNVKVGAEIKEFQKQMLLVSREFKAMGDKLQATSNTIRNNITLPFVAAAGAGLKFASDLESELVKINTLVGISGEAFASMRKNINEVSAATGKARAELAQAAFTIQSAGLRGAEANELLAASAKASVVGLGEQKEIARASTAMMQAYGAENMSAARSVDLLTAVVREGNLEASELAPAIGKVLPVAKALGVSFEEVGANIAVFTRLGISSSEAVTALKATLAAFLKPSEKAKKAVAELGLSFDVLRTQLRSEGLAAVMQTLLQATNGNVEALGELMPSIEGLSNVLGTAGAQGDAYAQVLNNIRNSTGMVDEGFKMASQGSAVQFNKVLNDLRNAGISLGETLMPVFQKIAGAVQQAVAAFQGLEKSQQENIIKITALVAASPLVISALAGVSKAFGSVATIIAKSVIPGVANFVKAISTGSPLVIGMLALGGVIAITVVYWDEIKIAVERATTAFSNLVKENALVRAGVTAIGGAFIILKNTISAAIQNLVLLGGALDNLFRRLLTGNWAGFGDDVEATFFKMQQNSADATQSIIDDISAMHDKLSTSGTPIITADAMQEAVDKMKKPFQDLRDFVNNLFEGSSPIAQIEADANAASPAVQRLTTDLAALGGTATLNLGNMRTSMANVVDGIDEMRLSWYAFWDEMNRNLEFAMANMVGDLVSGLAMAAAAGQGFGDVMRNLNLQLANMLENMGKAAIHKGLIDGVLQAVLPPGMSIAIGLGALAFAGVLRGSMNQARGGMNIPAFANGALVYGPQLALVGDNINAARDPEVISPLSKLQAMIDKRGGGGPTQVYGRLNGADLYITSERTAYAIKRTTGRR